MSLYKRLSVVFSLLILGGCGFQPLYGPDSSGNVAAEFSKIRILPIKDRLGQQLRNRLLTALNSGGIPGNPSYILKTIATETTASLALRKSAFATRANLKVSTSFHLYSTIGNEEIYSGSSAITVSYNILDSDFATLSAEKDARKRAVRDVAEDMRLQLGAHFSQAGSNNKSTR